MAASSRYTAAIISALILRNRREADDAFAIWLPPPAVRHAGWYSQNWVKQIPVILTSSVDGYSIIRSATPVQIDGSMLKFISCCCAFNSSRFATEVRHNYYLCGKMLIPVPIYQIVTRFRNMTLVVQVRRKIIIQITLWCGY